jgi:hypothetical protein
VRAEEWASNVMLLDAIFFDDLYDVGYKGIEPRCYFFTAAATPRPSEYLSPQRCPLAY